jgi:K+ transporter
MSTTSPSISLPRGVAALPAGGTRAMALSALGVVFGDIGTSPLYTLKTVLGATGAEAAGRAAALGSLSLIVWTLIIITTIKYVFIAMRVDNHGEGGIMAGISPARASSTRRRSCATRCKGRLRLRDS